MNKIFSLCQKISTAHMNAYLKHLFIPKCGFLRSPFSCGNLYRRKLPNFVDASYNIPLRSRAEQRLA